MLLHCGLDAVNALLRGCHGPGATADELDGLTRQLHEREREVHPDGADLRPDPRGNYPVEALILALRGRGLGAEYVRGAGGGVAPRDAVGYLLGTGDHYVAVVRGDRGGWVLYDNGVPSGAPVRSPRAAAQAWSQRRAVRIRAVLRVRRL